MAKPLLEEMLRNSSIDQAITIEFLRDAPGMQRAAAKKLQRFEILINSNEKQRKARDIDQHKKCLVVVAIPCMLHAEGCCVVHALGVLETWGV